jgi:hypothetical protein
VQSLGGLIHPEGKIIICFQQFIAKLIQVFGEAGGGFHRIHILAVVYINTLELPEKKSEYEEQEEE